MNARAKIAVGAASVLLAAAGAKHLVDRLAPPGPRDAAIPETCAGIASARPASVFLADLTWQEVCAALAAGMTTVIVPTGGFEQGGPHVVLSKHDHVVRATSERIARELGDALVAPVVTYVPQGEIDPPTNHMPYAGTISVPHHVFESVLVATARSLRQHGFRHVAFVGDSGGNQRGQERAAARLSRGWGADAVFHVPDYYDENANGQLAWLLSQGETEKTIGSHTGIRDTSEMLAANPAGVRVEKSLATPDREKDGASGDATRASAERGETMLQLKVDAAVKQIRALRGR